MQTRSWWMAVMLVAGLVLSLGGCPGSSRSDEAGNAVKVEDTKAEDPKPAAAAANPAGNARPDWPTEEQVKATVGALETSIHASEHNKSVWKVKGVRHEWGEVKLGQTTMQKQMEVGSQMVTVYPAKVTYTRVTEYQHKDPVRDEIKGGVAYMYRDSFGDWQCKIDQRP